MVAGSGVHVCGFVGGLPRQLKQLSIPNSQQALQVSEVFFVVELVATEAPHIT